MDRDVGSYGDTIYRMYSKRCYETNKFICELEKPGEWVFLIIIMTLPIINTCEKHIWQKYLILKQNGKVASNVSIIYISEIYMTQLIIYFVI